MPEHAHDSHRYHGSPDAEPAQPAPGLWWAQIVGVRVRRGVLVFGIELRVDERLAGRVALEERDARALFGKLGSTNFEAERSRITTLVFGGGA